MNESRDLFERWKSEQTKPQKGASVEQEAPDAARLFNLLSAIAAEDRKAPLGFLARVQSGIEQVIESEKRRKVMLRLCLYGVAALLGLYVLASNQGTSQDKQWAIIQASLGLAVLALALFSGLVTLGLKRLKVAGALAAVVLVVLVARSNQAPVFDASSVITPGGASKEQGNSLRAATAPISGPKTPALEEKKGAEPLISVDVIAASKGETAPALPMGGKGDAAQSTANSAGSGIALQPDLTGNAQRPLQRSREDLSPLAPEGAALSKVTEIDSAVAIESRDEEAFTEPARAPAAAPAMTGTEDIAPLRSPNHLGAQLHNRLLTTAERYGQYEENSWGNPRIERTSTFGLDVDTASYTNMRRFIRQGQLPPKDSVRIEEFINYFSYQYPAPRSEPFGLTYEIAPSPLRDGYHLLRIGIKARESSDATRHGWNLVFLVDVSGSMSEPTKLPLVKQSLKLLVQQMRAEDRIALVTYAGSSGVVLPSTPGSEQAAILQAIESLGAGGSTYGSAGIELAYQQAQLHYRPGSVNRVILATDGDFNVGVSSFDGLMSLIEQKKKSGITLTTLGFGQGNINEHMMEQLADRGNGNFFYIDSFSEARKVLERDLHANVEIVAKDVKLQLEFNPLHVAKYRLIGFDNRRLAHEDFADDTKDAGEVGAGHTVTALYELALTDSAAARTLAQEYRYDAPTAVPQRESLTSELGFLRLRYKEPEGTQSKLLDFPLSRSAVKSDSGSSDFRFAAAVAGFGLFLRQSQFAPSASLADIKSLAERALGEDDTNQRRELVGLIDDASRLTARD